MKKYFAYTRVSTVKQGVHGVSLTEQRSAIETHALRNGLEIIEWFEETVTAAKTGRLLFTDIIKRLRKGEAQGLIIHKVDRSARNLKDWAALSELIDGGIDVQVSADSYDLSSRGGRLSADIQAVIAADYIRNLREECLKGLRGRLKQGIYPFKAPVGYVDNGGGELKTIDPVQGPLVRRAFELYATNRYSLISLGEVMHMRGLRSSVGGNLGKNGLSRILNNSFYHGTIYIRASKETYAGKHEPLVTKAVYNRVQDILSGKLRKKLNTHSFAYRRMFKCQHCQYSLIGENQKGYVYYRCHTPSCEMKTIRETKLIKMIDDVLGGIQITETTFGALTKTLEETKSKSAELQQSQLETSKLQLANVKSRVERLMDLFIDGKINQTAFDTKQQSLQDEVKGLEHQLSHSSAHIGQVLEYVEKFLELAESLILGYQSTPDDVRGDLLKSITSNPTISPIHVDIPVNLPWSLFVNPSCVPSCGDGRDRPRTFIPSALLSEWSQDTVDQLIKFFSSDESKAFVSKLEESIYCI